MERVGPRMLAYAEAVATDASKIGESEIEDLRKVGFMDRGICDMALCALWRCFVSRCIDAVGASPEAAHVDADPTFRAALTIVEMF